MRVNWTFEKLRAEALKYNTRGEFKSGSYNAYYAAAKKKVLNRICSHMPKTSNRPWIDEELRFEASTYLTKNDFRLGSSGAYDAAKKRGDTFFESICSHMPKRSSVGEKHHNYKWTDEALFADARKYSMISDFKKYSPSVYSLCRNRGILNQSRAHMSSVNNTWTDEALLLKASQHETPMSLKRADPGAYSTIIARKLSSTAFSHMNKSKTRSHPEGVLFRCIKEQFPSATKYIDTKVKISGKSHIKRFEIDIFVPELNRGIEFDGTYHHSFEFMRKTHQKRFWSDEDLHNYHGIKDDWFETRGIKILHIKEEEWKLDRDGCVMRCFDFLNSTENSVSEVE